MLTLRLSTYAVNWRFFLPSERKGLLGYYTVAWRYEFYFRLAKQCFMNERSEWVKYCFCHEKIKFISSRHRVMFFLLYRQKDMDKITGGNDRNYVIDKLMCEIMENKPLGSRMQFLWILRVVYFPVKHSCVYNKYGQRTLFLSQSIDSHRKLTVLSKVVDMIFILLKAKIMGKTSKNVSFHCWRVYLGGRQKNFEFFHEKRFLPNLKC